jgi:hypothetical protein
VVLVQVVLRTEPELDAKPVRNEGTTTLQEDVHLVRIRDLRTPPFLRSSGFATRFKAPEPPLSVRRLHMRPHYLCVAICLAESLFDKTICLLGILCSIGLRHAKLDYTIRVLIQMM